MAQTLTDNQKTAFAWWDELSINEMKSLAKKHYNGVFSHNDLYTFGADWIEGIYDAELPNLRWVYGTATKKWYLVTSFDRDYNHGISQNEMMEIGFEQAKIKYLSPSIVK